MQQLSRLYHLPKTQQTWYAAHQWYVHATKDTPMTEWTYFTDNIIRNFSPDRNTTSDLAPPHHTSSVNDYINNFIAYARCINITSIQHQVRHFVSSLQVELQVAVVHHHPCNGYSHRPRSYNGDPSACLH